MIKRDPRLQAFVDKITGVSQAECEAAEICPTCRKPIGEFRNDLSRKEYEISGMCQSCQDSVFGKD